MEEMYAYTRMQTQPWKSLFSVFITWHLLGPRGRLMPMLITSTAKLFIKQK